MAYPHFDRLHVLKHRPPFHGETNTRLLSMKNNHETKTSGVNYPHLADWTNGEHSGKITKAE